ncbi:MAG: hypothetical protein JSR38_14025, partial [Proteobacteria bacterium]|nr:hypothetical protein [Pseudomonadota bacterium]
MQLKIRWIGALALLGALAACGGAAEPDGTDTTTESSTEDAQGLATLRRMISVTVSGGGTVAVSPGGSVCSTASPCALRYRTYTKVTLTA